MTKNSSLAILAAALVATTAIAAVAAPAQRGRPNNPQYQKGFEDGYSEAFRQAYRQGYNDARGNRRYDDSDYSYGWGHDNDYGNDPRFTRWRARYQRAYTYTDDNFYQECRTSIDPAGVIAGALIGGLLGNAVGSGGGRTGATVAGVVVGGALGAALTKDLNCDDRSYAYKTYYDGFNAGRPNATYQWRNPRNGNYGNFRVADYYNDADNFRCANYTQQIFINGRPQAASGRACQQPDGTWAIVN